MITAKKAQERFAQKVIFENQEVFVQLENRIESAIDQNRFKIIIKFNDDLSKDTNDNILDVLKFYGYDINFWYVQKIIVASNGMPHTIDEPAGYIISWKI